MTALITTLHIVVCIALICIVLLQTGKGASLGAAFGGSTQTVFGASGSAGFFEKITTAVAVIFMLTSLCLTYISANRGGGTIMREAAPQVEPAPAVPSQEDVWPLEEPAPGEAPAAESAVPEAPPTVPNEAETTQD